MYIYINRVCKECTVEVTYDATTRGATTRYREECFCDSLSRNTDMQNFAALQRKVKSQHLREQLFRLQNAELQRKALFAPTGATSATTTSVVSEKTRQSNAAAAAAQTHVPAVISVPAAVESASPRTRWSLYPAMGCDAMSGAPVSVPQTTTASVAVPVPAPIESFITRTIASDSYSPVTNQVLHDMTFTPDMRTSPLRHSLSAAAGSTDTAGDESSLQWIDAYGASEQQPDWQIATSRPGIIAIDRWLSLGKNRPTVSFFLHGATGAGKTCAARIALARHGFSIYVISADNAKQYGSVSMAIKEIATRRPLFTQPTAIIVDGIDAIAGAMDKAAQGRDLVESAAKADAVSALSINDLASTLQALQPSRTHPVIFTCTELADARVRKIRDISTQERLSNPSAEAITKLGWRVLEQRGLTSISTMWIQNIAHLCRGDVRQFLQMLQFETVLMCHRRITAPSTHPSVGGPAVVSAPPAATPSSASSSSSSSVRTSPDTVEPSYNIFSASREVIFSSSARAAVRAANAFFGNDTFMLGAVIHHNLFTTLSPQLPIVKKIPLSVVTKKYPSAKDISETPFLATMAMTDSLSVLDVLETPFHAAAEHQQEYITRHVHQFRYRDGSNSNNSTHLPFPELPEHTKAITTARRREAALRHSLSVLQGSLLSKNAVVVDGTGGGDDSSEMSHHCVYASTDALDRTLYLRLRFEQAWKTNPDALVSFCLDQQMTDQHVDAIRSAFPTGTPVRLLGHSSKEPSLKTRLQEHQRDQKIPKTKKRKNVAELLPASNKVAHPPPTKKRKQQYACK